MIRNALLCIVLATLVGCASIQTPSAKVTGVAVTAQSKVGASVRATVQLHNPNDVVLPLVLTHYEIDVAGLPSFSFDRVPDQAIPAKADQTLDLTAGFGLKSGQTIAGRVYRVTGYASVQPPGKLWQIYRQSGVPLPKARFSATGRFPENSP